jgi:amino acid adenylation domain-containing protein
MHLRAPFDAGKLRAALDQLAANHPVLRTSFDLDSYSEQLQLVHRKVEIPLEVYDLSNLSEGEQAERLERWFEAEKQRKFEWTQSPLLRFQIHLRNAGTFQLTWTEHHAILDGWSVASMIAELFHRYLALVNDQTYQDDALPKGTFRDYVATEKESIQSEEHAKFWERKLEGSTLMRLPRWPLLPQSFEENKQSSHNTLLSPEISDGLNELARSASVPLKSVVLAAHLRVMSFLGGCADVLTGLIANGRPAETGGERILGLFLNSIPFRLALTGGSWSELIRRTFAAERELLPCRLYPLAELQRRHGVQPLFETLFNFVHFHVYQSLVNLDQLNVLDGRAFQATNFTLATTFSLDVTTKRVGLLLDYDGRQLTRSQVEIIAGYYERALKAMTDDPDHAYDRQGLLSPAERSQVLEDWNRTDVRYPPEKCLHQLFEEQVDRTPEGVAVVWKDEQLSYTELNHRANQLAHYLRSRGVGPETLVAILVDRSILMLVGLLGIIKAGGAYLPLDPGFPSERLSFMLKDSGADVLLTQQHLLESSDIAFNPGQSICLDANWKDICEQETTNPPFNVIADNLAYVIYTSGSTGQPKGVQISHGSLVNFLHSMKQQPGLTPQDTLLAVTSLSFDIAALELYLPLTVGARVVLASRQEAGDGAQLRKLIRASMATVMQATPATWRLLIEAGWEGEPSFKILCGGEALPPELAEKLSGLGTELWNLYGPTETTVWSSVKKLVSPATQISIGRPIANTQIYILDEQLQPIPKGVVGEVYIGGEGVSRGYLRRPDDTAEKFIPHPFNPAAGSRLYRTGDLARYLADGEIEFLGRSDHQIKVRGFRIELGEIETVLRSHAAVRDCVVSATDGQDGDRRLIAYVVSAPAQVPAADEWRRFLSAKLPNYMIPNAFVSLSKLPTTPNGKLDRKALPGLVESPLELRKEYVVPHTPEEKALAQIWSVSLRVGRIGLHDDFFDLGGHSLLAMQVIKHIRETFSVDLSLDSLFQNPTLSALASVIIAKQIEQAGESAIAEMLTTIRQLSDEEVTALLNDEEAEETSGLKSSV